MEFLQLCSLPDTPSLPPGLQQHRFTTEERTDRLLKVIGPAATDPVRVHQDAAVFVSRLSPSTAVAHDFPPGPGRFPYLIEGSASVGAQHRTTGEPAKNEAERPILTAATAGSDNT